MGVLADGFNKRDLEAGIGMVTYFVSKRAHSRFKGFVSNCTPRAWIEENFTAPLTKSIQKITLNL